MTFGPELKALLASPRGILVRDDSVLKELLRDKEIITVGDVTTKRSLELGLCPKLAIFDGLTRRSLPIEIRAKRVIKVRNPRGKICLEAVEGIKKAFGEGKWVKVEGEEDLLAIPALLLAPDGHYVLYGQPGAGVVLLESNEYTKRHFIEILLLAEGDVEEMLSHLDQDPH